MADRIILHSDLNCFYASVEVNENPKLRDQAIAVCGSTEERHGIVLTASYPAKRRGVKTGMANWQAVRACPGLICVPPHYDLYVKYSRLVRNIYLRYTDKMEPYGMDECWLDVSGSRQLHGDGTAIAEEIRKAVRDELGLTVSIGVSFNKIFAKLGSDMKKPDATTVISRENFRKVVWPLDVSELLYIGSRTKRKLNEMGIFTLGDLANANPSALKARFGVVGERMRNSALGLDCDEVRRCGEEREIKSVGHGTTTLRDMTTYADAETVIALLSEMVAMRLRRYGFNCGVVKLDVRRNDLTHVGKQCAVHSTFLARDIYNAAARLLRSVWKGSADKPLRSLSVNVSDLSPVGEGVQQSLFDGDDKQQKLELSLDKIRKKFGFGAIKTAKMLNNDLVSKDLTSEDDLLPFKR